MEDQPVVVGVDLGDAGVVALEAQPVGRDDAVEFVQRGERDRTLARGGQPFDIAANDLRLMFGGMAVSAHRDAVAQDFGPIRHVGRLVRRIAGSGGRGRPSESGCAAERKPFRR